MGFGTNLVAVAILGYLSKQMSDNTADDQSEPQDEGVRLQVEADIDNKIPILYGAAHFGGYGVDFERTANLKTAYYVIALSEITGEHLDTTPAAYTFHDVWLDDNKVTFQADGITVDATIDSNGNEDESMRGLIKIYMYSPDPLQPDGFGGTTPNSYDVIPSWNIATHLMTDLMFAIVELTYNKSKNVAELPKCTFHMENSLTLPGDVLNDYAQNSIYGANIPASSINSAQMNALNVYGAAGFTYTDLAPSVQSGTIDINGLVDTAQKTIANMEDICRSVNAWLVYDSHVGQWGARINEAGSSVISFDDSNIIGSIKVSGTSITQLYNIADVRFQNADIIDKTDFVKITTDLADLKANERDTTMTINLPYTNKQVVAVKVGLVALKQARADKSITFRTDYSYLNVDAGEIIDVTSAVYNYTNELFRIISVSEFDTLDGIEVEFSCIQYDPAVYEYDIEEFAIETEDGALTIGSIGTPNTPLVDDHGTANLPHVIINMVIPSGTVDEMEIWITHDVSVPLDLDRVYIKIGITSNTDGTLYIENDAETFRYSELEQGDFYVKIRGSNNVNVGPFSLFSGLVEYEPVQVTDQLTIEPMSFGEQVAQLGAMYLLNNLDILQGGVEEDMDIAMTRAQVPGWDGIGNLTDALTNDAGFVSDMGAAIGSAPVIIDDLDDVDTTTIAPTLLDRLHWDGVNWVPVAPPADDAAIKVRCLVPVAVGYNATGAESNPPGTVDSPLNDLGDNDLGVPFAQGLFVQFTSNADPIENSLQAGNGNAILYKSDGTVVETISAASFAFGSERVIMPFADRDPCTDYYLTLDPGAVIYGELVADQCDSFGLCIPENWGFSTKLADPIIPSDTPLDPNPDPGDTPPPTDPDPDAPPPECKGFNRKLILAIDYGYPVEEGTGIIRIKKDGVNEFAIPACEAEYEGSVVTLPQIIADYGIDNPGYTVLADAGAVIATDDNPGQAPDQVESEPVTTPVQAAGPSDAVVDDPRSGFNLIDLRYDQEVAPGPNGSFRLFNRKGILIETIPAGDGALGYVNDGIQVLSIAVENATDARVKGRAQVNALTTTNIKMTFDDKIVPDNGKFYLYESPSTLIQTFDLMEYFVTDKSDEDITYDDDFIVINPTVCLDSGTSYHIRADSGAIMGRCGNTFPGIADDTWEFTTAEAVVPTMTAPAAGANNNPVSEGIALNIPGLSNISDTGDGPETSGENLVGGAGQWQLVKDGTGVVETGYFDKTDRDSEPTTKLINSEK